MPTVFVILKDAVDFLFETGRQQLVATINIAALGGLKCQLKSIVCRSLRCGPPFSASHVLPTLALGSSLSAKSLKSLERVKGIEPSSSAWKAVALPLSYTRAGTAVGVRCRYSCSACLVRCLTVCCPPMVGEVGLEPTKA